MDNQKTRTEIKWKTHVRELYKRDIKTMEREMVKIRNEIACKQKTIKAYSVSAMCKQYDCNVIDILKITES